MKRSRTQEPDHHLLGMKNARKMLRDWANLAAPVNESIEWLWRHHRNVVRPIASKHGERIVSDIRQLLRLAWDATDSRSRDWFLVLARTRYAQGCVAASYPSGFGLNFAEKTFPGPPEGEASAFDSALFYAQTTLAHKMQHCKANCSAPYFFRRRKGQKYCCTDCSEPALLAQRNRWWSENRGKGSRWLLERRRNRKIATTNTPRVTIS